MIEPHSYPDLLQRYPELRRVNNRNVTLASCRIFAALHMAGWVGRPSDRQQLAQLLGYGKPDQTLRSLVAEKVDGALEGVIPPEERVAAVQMVGRIFSNLPVSPIEDDDWDEPKGGVNSYVQKHERCANVHKRVLHGVVSYVNLIGRARMYPGPFLAGWWGEAQPIELKHSDFPYTVPSLPETQYYTANDYLTPIPPGEEQQWLVDQRAILMRDKFTYSIQILSNAAQECMVAAREAIAVPADYSAESTLLLGQLASALRSADGDGMLTVQRVTHHLDIDDDQKALVIPILSQYLPTYNGVSGATTLGKPLPNPK